MKKKKKQKIEAFDEAFDDGKIVLDFGRAVKTKGLSQLVKLPPLSIPAWINAELERLAQFQANSKSAVIRQLLVEALQGRHGIATAR